MGGEQVEGAGNGAKKKIVVFGAEGHAKVVIDILRKQDKYDIVGIIDKDKSDSIGQRVLGVEIIGTDSQLPELVKDKGIEGGIVAIGFNYCRMLAVEKIKGLLQDRRIRSFEFATAIHPDACLADEKKIGEGTVVMAGAVVNPCAKIGNHCIINTNSSVDHDCRIEDYVGIAPNACVGGNVDIGKCTWIGIAATVLQDRNIGCHTVVGAGATVLHNLGSHVVAHGIPARMHGVRNEDENYLKPKGQKKHGARQ